jgi:Saccharopine dehydrogenase NADP binding domain
MKAMRVLVLGATGVFGSRLVELAATEPGLDLTLAARNRSRLEALAAHHCPDAAIRIIDRDQIKAVDLDGVDIVVDAAGPFQDSHCRVVEAALAARVHYVDLADGRDFVCQITRFDAQARAAGIAMISGASTIPAMSHAVVDHLTDSWRGIDTICVGIFPGNRAPRGLSVVEAILSYAGKPVRQFQDGRWQAVPGWGMLHRWSIAGVGRRWASVCDTPDQELLVEHYRPKQAAQFFAGLELTILHLGLALLCVPVRLGLIGSLRPAAKPLLWLAQRFLALGGDVGAMEIRVSGQDALGQAADAQWTLRAEGNRGPFVPVLACLALLRRFRDGLPPPVGASPCVAMLPLAVFAADCDRLGIKQMIR